MKKKIGIISFVLMASVLAFFGCNNPYEKLSLNVDKSDVVLYVGSNTDVSPSPNEKLTDSIIATVSGGGKGVSTDVSFSQIGNDIVDITKENQGGGKTKITFTAKSPGKSVVRITSNEGQKQKDINVVVYKKIENVAFTNEKFAIKVNGECNLNNYLDFSPSDTNQKEMNFYLVDANPLEPVYDENHNLIETKYAKISNGVLFAKDGARFPIDDQARDAIKVIGVSKHNENVTTGEFYVPVVYIIQENEIAVSSNTEDGSINLSKNDRGEYELILVSNETGNDYFSKRYLTFNLGLYTVDQQYTITTSKLGEPITNSSKFELLSLVDDESRFNYDPYTASGDYPYKKFEFQQLRNGTETIVFKIDHIGFEGLFTIEIRVKVTVKEFPKEIETFNQEGGEILSENTDKLQVYNTYDENVAGTYLKYIANPNSNPMKFSFNVLNMPTGYENSVLIYDKYKQFINLNEQYDYKNYSDLNVIFIKHNMDSVGINKINKDKLPVLVVTFYYSLNPSSTPNEFYKTYELKKNINLDLRIGLNKDSYIVNEKINVNVATGKQIADNGDVLYPIILAQTSEQINLNESIKSLKLLSVNGNPVSTMPEYSSSNFDVMNNHLYSLEFITDEDSNGLFRTLIVIPNTTGKADRIKLEITTVNGFVRTSEINFFAPLPYKDADSVHVEIGNIESTIGSIYDYSQSPYKFDLTDGKLNLIASEFEGDAGYRTVNAMSVTTNARIPLNVYNYIVVNNKLQAINNNFNVTIGAPFNYFTIESSIENGVQNYYLVTKSIESKIDQTVNIVVEGYNELGVKVSFTHVLRVKIFKRIESISITPANANLIEVSSLGAMDIAKSTVKVNVTCIPSVNFETDGTSLSFKLLNEVVYSHTEPNGTVTNFYSRDFIQMDNLKGVFTATLSNEAKAKINNISNLSYDDMISRLYQNPIVVKYYAYVQQFNKEPIIKMGNVTITRATKVENIIPSVNEDGLYFDNYHEDSTQLKSITFNVLPTTAYNTKLIARIKNTNIAKIVSGVDSNGIINSLNNEIKIQGLLAGTTSIIVGAVDSLSEGNIAGVYNPTKYVEIRIKVADGSELNPFEIRNVREFLQIGTDINAGKNDFYYTLASSVDLSGINFEPFGKFNGGLNAQFKYENTGVYYSVQNYIYGFNIERNIDIQDSAEASYNQLNYGLFSALGTNAKIENVIIDKASITVNATDNTSIHPFNKNLNVGIIAGLSEGAIYNSQVSGDIVVNTNIVNVNVGGFVGELQTHFVYKLNGGGSESITFTGFVNGLPPITSDFNNNNVNSSVNIKLVSPRDLSDDTNKNLGGIAGYVVTTASNSQTNNTFVNLNDVTVNQIYSKNANIKNVNVNAVIQSVYDESGIANSGNIGGIIGKSLGAYLDNITASNVLVGYSNIGGIIGYAENSYLNKIIVEFSNSGKTGINTASIIGTNNVGGLVGYGKNLTIEYSYVRSYYNNLEIDNINYVGNIVVLSAGETKNVYVGGLVGYLANKNIHEQLTKKDPSDKTHIINGTYKNGIFNSYFNADINANYGMISENVIVGGLVGGNEQPNENMDGETADENTSRNSNSLVMKDSYVFGQIKVADKVISDEIITEITGDVEMGTTVSYSANNQKIEKTTKRVYGIEENGTYHYFSAVSKEIVSTYGLLVGNNTLNSSSTNTIVSKVYKLDGVELEDIYNDDNVLVKDVETQISEITNGQLVIETTTKYETTFKQSYKQNNTISSTYATVNNSELSGLHEYIENIDDSNLGTAEKEVDVLKVTYQNFTVETLEYSEGVVASNEIENNTQLNSLQLENPYNLNSVDTFKNANFKIIDANAEFDSGAGGEIKEAWAIYSGFNMGYPVLFDFDSTVDVLYKLLPNKIEANVLDFNLSNFNNRSYLKVDHNKIILFYNENGSAKSPDYMNKYLIRKKGSTSGSSSAVTIIDVDLNLDFESNLPISPVVDTNLIITSDSSIIKILNGGEIQTTGLGLATLKIASKLNESIFDEVEVLVVNGVSDFSLYANKNTTDETNKFLNGRVLTEYIDYVSSYYLDVENTLKESIYFTKYNKNTNVGYQLTVGEFDKDGNVVNNNTGIIELNNQNLVNGKTYLFEHLGEFNVKGITAGNITLTLTPFIQTNQPNFGTTLFEDVLDANNKFLNSCVLINDLKKVYTFNVLAKADSISINNKTGASITPTGKDEVTVSIVTSNFTYADNQYVISEDLQLKIYNSKTNELISGFSLGEGTVGENNSLLMVTILGIDKTPIKSSSGEVLKIKVDFRLQFNFDTEKYKDRNSGLNYNLNEQNFKLVFSPTSNLSLTDEYLLNIVPTPVNSIEAAFYANGEYSGDGSQGSFNPQEQSTDYIAPGKTGLLKFNVFPEFNNATSVEIGVNNEYKSLVGFTQNLAVMNNSEMNVVTGYETLYDNPQYTPDGKLILQNKSIRDFNGVSFNGAYYLKVMLDKNAPQNEVITFTINACITVDGVKEIIKSYEFKLKIQPLPNVYLSIDGSDNGVVALGTSVGLDLEKTNVESVNFDVSSDAAYIDYDIVTNRLVLNISSRATLGEMITITAKGSAVLNGAIEQSFSSIRIKVVPFVIKGFELSGGVPNGNRYGMEILNGTTNALGINTIADYNADIPDVVNRLSLFNSLVSGNNIATNGNYMNNWYKYSTNSSSGTDVFELLSINNNYIDYEFVDITEPGLGSMVAYHYYGIKALKIPAPSTNHTLAYKMKYYYDANGNPQKYDENLVVGETSYEQVCIINLTIKDNSTYDHPNPIETKQEFLNLANANTGHYILINDIVLDDYEPFAANFLSLDGNGYTIKIKNFNMSKYKNASSVTTGMFETISSETVLKNITLDVSDLMITREECNEFVSQANTNDESLQARAKINLAFIPNVNFGLIAGSNEGSITNCRVVNLNSQNLSNSYLYVNTTQSYLNGSQTQANISGLVATNSGSISNSFIGKNVGGASFNDSTSGRIVGAMEVAKRLTDSPTSDAQINIVQSYPFALVGGKTISGFVGNNSGIIANSYNREVGVINISNKTFSGSKTSGFVLNNGTGGNIFNCFVEGANVTDFRADNSIYIEGIGYMGGFVYENSGSIKNAYSNIKINTNSGGSGGFVYSNLGSGTIENAYTTANNAFNSKAHGQFTGLDSTGTINNLGTLQSCFYLVFESEIANVDEPATPISGKRSTDTEDKSNPFRYQGSFNGFSFASGNETNSIWKMSESLNYGPQLVSCISNPTFSFRKLLNVADSSTGEMIYNYEYNTNFKYGSTKNPLLVNTANDFITFIINNSKTLRNDAGQTESVFGIRDNTPGVDAKYNIRLINDLDFNEIDLSTKKVDGKIINDIIFVGELDGNGMKMSGVEINNSRMQTENFGLFKQIGLSDTQLGVMGFNLDKDNVKTIIKNLTMTIGNFISNDAMKVGAFAGSIYNTSIINTEIVGEENVVITGRNLVGGYAGLIENNADCTIVDVRTNNITVIANFRSNTTANANTQVNEFGMPYTILGSNSNIITRFEYFQTYRDTLNAAIGNSIINKLSYAGSIAGVIIGNNRLLGDSYPYISQDKNGENNGGVGVVNTGDGKTWTPGSITASNQESINTHRTMPDNNKISNLKVYGGGTVQAEQAGGMFGYVGENTHIKNSSYIVGTDEDRVIENQRIIGYHYAGGIVAENYGFLEQVYIENSPKQQEKYDLDVANGMVAGPDNLFDDTGNVVDGNSREKAYPIAIGGIVGFTDRSIILDSFSKINVMNEQSKIAGGIIGLATRENYMSHVFTTGDVYGKNVIGGAIGLYNQTGRFVVYNRLTGTAYGDVISGKGTGASSSLENVETQNKITDLTQDLYKKDANGLYFLKIKNGNIEVQNMLYDPSDGLVKDVNGDAVIYNASYKLLDNTTNVLEAYKPDGSDNTYLKVKDGYKNSIVNNNDNRKKYCIETEQNQKFNLDYVFALNTWGEKTKVSVMNNLNKYYQKSAEAGVVSYYKYNVRMPEIGNQAPQIGGTLSDVTVDKANNNNFYKTNIDAIYKSLNTSVGSLIGKLKIGKTLNINDSTTIISGTDLIKDTATSVIAYNQNAATDDQNASNYSKAALLTSRLVKVLNKSDVNGRGTVISTTFNDAKLSNGIDGSKYDAGSTGYELDYTGAVPSEQNPNLVGDMLFYNNKIGSQFKLSSIYGTDNVNSNMLSMFKIDSELKPEDTNIEEGATLEKLFSQTWKLQDEGYLPEYIIGIYSNFNKIESYEDLVKLTVNRNTKNQFYVLAKNKDSNGDYTIKSGQEEGVRNYLFNSDFEGTLIGEPFYDEEVNAIRNPKIISSYLNKSIFNNITTATIQNIDFDILTMSASSVEGEKEVTANASGNAGLFANNITSSIMSNVNFTINSTLMNANLNLNHDVKNFGLVFGSVVDSSFNTINLTVQSLANTNNSDVDKNRNGFKINAYANVENIGMLAAMSNRSNYSNIQAKLTMKNADGTDANDESSILVNLNYNNLPTGKTVATQTNVGGLFGDINGSTVIESVNTNIISENNNGVVTNTFDSQILNNQIRIIKTHANSYVNYGGVVGKITSGSLTEVNYFGNMLVGYLNNNGTDNYTRHASEVLGTINVGGIAGLAENASLESCKVNSKLNFNNDGTVEEFIRVPQNSATTNTPRATKVNGNGVVVVGGIVGYSNNSSIQGNSTIQNNSINSNNIIISTQKANTFVGGIAGIFITTNGDKSISNAINVGSIFVTHDGGNEANNGKTLILGGIAGQMKGGTINQVANYGNLNIASALQYRIGGLVGTAENNNNTNAIINNYINYGDITLLNKTITGSSTSEDIITNTPAVDATSSTQHVLSGVVGYSLSTGLSIRNGFTVARIYGCPKIADKLRGISYGFNPDDSNNKNYYVEEFNPYSSNNLEQSVRYDELSATLNRNLTSNLFVEGTKGLKLPQLSKLIDPALIDNAIGKVLFGNDVGGGSGSKLNPKQVNGTIFISDGSDNTPDMYYLLTGTNVQINVSSETFTGLIIGKKENNKYPTITLSNTSSQYLVKNNSGIIANLQINLQKFNKFSSGDNAFIALNNTQSGTILNCVTYGEINANLTNAQIGGIVATNSGKILKSGSSFMYSNEIASSVKIGGIAVYNSGSIFDCYSTTSIIASSTAQFGGLVYENAVTVNSVKNTGSVLNSYYAGTHSAGYESDKTPVSYISGGEYKNVYYDAEAAGIVTVTAGINAVSTRKLQSKGADKNGIVLNDKNSAIWNQTDLYKSFDVNYGYPTILGGCVIPTFAIYNQDKTFNLYQTNAQSAENVIIPIMHAGMLNKLSTANTYNVALYTDINLTNVNKGEVDAIGKPGVFIPIPSWTKNFEGNSKVISNLRINSYQTNGAGLFENSSGNISNLSLNDATLEIAAQSEDKGIGALVGIMSGGKIDNIQLNNLTLNANNNNNVGGLVGKLSSSNSGSSNTISNITINAGSSTINGNKAVGGLVGLVEGGTNSISNIKNSMSINGIENVGGIIGSATSSIGTMTNVEQHASVSGTTNVGGIGGNIVGGVITGVRNEDNVTATKVVGGLFGVIQNSEVNSKADSSNNNSYNKGNVIGNEFLGGLAGFSRSTKFIGVTAAPIYSSGDVGKDDNSINSEYVGGLFGEFEGGSASYFTIKNKNSSETNIYGYKYVGGIAGRMSNSASFSNSSMKDKINIYYRSTYDMDNDTGAKNSLSLGIPSSMNAADVDYNNYFGMGKPAFDWVNNRVIEYGGNEFDKRANDKFASKNYTLYMGFMAGEKVSSTVTSVYYEGDGAKSEIREIYDTYRNYFYDLEEFHYVGDDSYRGKMKIQENKRWYKMVYSDASNSSPGSNISGISRDTYWFGGTTMSKADDFNQGTVTPYESRTAGSSVAFVNGVSFISLSNYSEYGIYFVKSDDISDVYKITNTSSGWNVVHTLTNMKGQTLTLTNKSIYSSGTVASDQGISLIALKTVKAENYKQGVNNFNKNDGGMTSATTIARYYSGLTFDGETFGVIRSSGEIAGKVGWFNGFPADHFNQYNFNSIQYPAQNLTYGSNRNEDPKDMAYCN